MNKFSWKNINKLKLPTGISDYYSPSGNGKFLPIDTLSFKSEGSTDDQKSFNADSFMGHHAEEYHEMNLLKNNEASRPDLIAFNNESRNPDEYNRQIIYRYLTTL